MNRVLDPAGNVRGLTAQKVNLENVLRIAWRLSGPGELIELSKDEGGWCLVIERPHSRSCLYRVEGKTISEITLVNARAARASLIESAWLDLVADGWSVDTV